MKVEEKLWELRDEDYARFQGGLMPNVSASRIIGVRVPLLRKFAKEYRKDEEHLTFLRELPHPYYDEDMLHVILIGQMKDYDTCIDAIEQFLPYIDNWMVCDTLAPKCLTEHRKELLERIRKWVLSSHAYTCRFGLKMLMTHYLEEDFQENLLEIPATIESEEYYVNMMIAWFYTTALAFRWEETIPYLEKQRLAKWIHNKTIQKAIESYRITPEQKALLRSMKRKNV